MWIAKCAMMSCEMDERARCADGEPYAAADLCDPWRRRMRRSAEHLRQLDLSRFEIQIGQIETCLQRDSEWGLEAALRSCERWRAALQPTD